MDTFELKCQARLAKLALRKTPKYLRLEELNGEFCYGDYHYPVWNTEALIERWDRLCPKFRQALEAKLG